MISVVEGYLLILIRRLNCQQLKNKKSITPHLLKELMLNTKTVSI